MRADIALFISTLGLIAIVGILIRNGKNTAAVVGSVGGTGGYLFQSVINPASAQTHALYGK